VPGWSTIFPGYTGGFTEKYTHNCEYTFASGTGTFTITGGSAGGWFRGYYNAGSDLEKVVITIDP
jgi:hypothetical protein